MAMSRGNIAALGAFYTLFTFIVYYYSRGTSLRTLPTQWISNWSHASPQSTSIPQSVQFAHDAVVELQEKLNTTFESIDLPTMGQRISTFSHLVEVIVADPSIDRQPFLDIHEQYFHWWKPSNSTYIPWKAQKKPEAGVVMCIGQGNFVLAAHTIQTLRNVVSSALPIEVAYAGDGDLPETKREELKALAPNIQTLDLLEYYDESIAGLKASGWAMKPFAALASRFERAILVDADVIFMQRPDSYFDEHPGLKETGTLFFHDRAYGDMNGWFKEILEGRKLSNTLEESPFWGKELQHNQESGVVFINKAKPAAFMSLMFTTYMNTERVRSEVIYPHTWGDKETFWLAAELSASPYTFDPHYAGIIGNLEDWKTAFEICSAQPLQLGLDERPFWFNAGMRLNKKTGSRELVNLTHWVPGGKGWDQPEWRDRGDNTFCIDTSPREVLSLEIKGLKELVNELVKEAEKVDSMFPEHDGG